MEKLRDIRLKAGFAQTAAAAQLGVERSTLAKWETGASNPNVDMVRKLAALYRCRIGELFGEEGAAEAPERKKKIRIVIEYDPETEKWSMNVDY